jgi:sec-independent protein translocase protein TatC
MVAPPQSPESTTELPPEQEPEGGTMTLLEHLLELRTRVTWAAGAIVAGMLVFFVPFIGFEAIEFLLAPAAQRNPDFRPQAITPMENIFTYFRVALLGGLALAMPMVLYQALQFLLPALTPKEKRWILPIAVGGSLSFVVGLAFGYFIVLPAAYGFLFSFGSSFADITPTISSYMDLTTRLLFVLGVVFQTPLVIMALAKFGVVSARKLWGWWRYAIVVAFAVSAIATPTPDPVTQSLVAGPIVVLYFVGIGLAWLVRRE